MDLTLEKKLQGFQLIAQEKLQAVICSIPGKKDLILEQNLIKPLERVCAASWLKLKGIQRIYKFDADTQIPHPTEDHVQVLMIQSQLRTFRRVLRHIHRLSELQTHDADTAASIKRYHIICVPNCFACFHSLLEEEGLYGIVQLHRFNWDFINLDQGVLSMEVPNVFATVFLRDDAALLPSIAQSLRVLQMVCGRSELIVTFGANALNIVEMLNSLNARNTYAQPGSNADISAMLIIDRDKDYASSLLTPAIYAGLLLEVFNHRAGEIELETQSNKILRQKLELFLLPEQQPKDEQAARSKPPTIHLSSMQDEIYGENRYKHFAHASSLVRSQAKAIGLEMQKLSEMKVDEMHDYVARKLPKIAELKTKVMRHLNASEMVIKMLGANFRKVQSLEEDILNNVSRKRILTELDELLSTDGQRYNVLRLLCLLHLCAGVATDELAQFVRNYCNYFGRQHLCVFQQLAKAGLLPPLNEEECKTPKPAKLLSNLPIPKFQQTEFQANANRLKLLVSSAGAEATPNASAGRDASAAGACPSYVFNSMYVPLVAQLCTFLLKANSAEDFAAKVGMVDKIQMHQLDGSGAYPSAMNAKSFASGVKQAFVKDVFPLRQRNIFVYVVGGLTYAEIGACDLVSRQTGAQIMVASDTMLSGADLIAAAF